MTGAAWYMEEKIRIGQQMVEFDKLPLEERLTQGRIAYEKACWAKRTFLIKGLWWMFVGGFLTSLLSLPLLK